MKTRILCTAATLLTVLLAGCVAQPVTLTPEAIAAQVKPGHRIRLTTRSGSRGEYHLVRVEKDALHVKPSGREGGKGAEQSIAYSDIRELTVSRANRTAISTGLTVAAVFSGLAILWSLDHMGACVAGC
jgi:hypothetical protein